MHIDTNCSSIYFVYPFLFEASTFNQREQAIEDASCRRSSSDQPLTIWQQQSFPDDDLLPHVARFLNPPDIMTLPSALTWQVEGNTFQSPAGLGFKAEWFLVYPHGEIRFLPETVQLALFYLGVGFLIIRVNLPTEQAEDWLDFLHYFRFVRGQRDVGVRAQRRVGFNQQTNQPEVAPFFPELAGGMENYQQNRGRAPFGAILDGLLFTGSLRNEANPWWCDIFVPGQLLPFATLFMQEPLPQDRHILYRLRNFFHSRQEILPSAADLRLDHPNLLPYADQQWFFFSLNGGGFVAFQPPTTDFFQKTLPDHLGKHYLLIFLLTLYQRFVLMMLSQEVAQYWLPDGQQASLSEREEIFGQLRDALLTFTARGYFAQVMQQEHHHSCYCQWQDTLQVDRLYQEVSNEVREMHSYLESQRVQRLQRQSDRLNLAVSLFAPPALALSFLEVTNHQSWWLAVLAILTTSLGGWLFYQNIRSRKD
jgi:hypothetical protein